MLMLWGGIDVLTRVLLLLYYSLVISANLNIGVPNVTDLNSYVNLKVHVGKVKD